MVRLLMLGFGYGLCYGYRCGQGYEQYYVRFLFWDVRFMVSVRVSTLDLGLVLGLGFGLEDYNFNFLNNIMFKKFSQWDFIYRIYTTLYQWCIPSPISSHFPPLPQSLVCLSVTHSASLHHYQCYGSYHCGQYSSCIYHSLWQASSRDGFMECTNEPQIIIKRT